MIVEETSFVERITFPIDPDSILLLWQSEFCSSIYYSSNEKSTSALRVTWAGWLAGRLVGWLVGWLAGWLVGWIVEWLDGWLVGWLSSWLAAWYRG